MCAAPGFTSARPRCLRERRSSCVTQMQPNRSPFVAAGCRSASIRLPNARPSSCEGEQPALARSPCRLPSEKKKHYPRAYCTDCYGRGLEISRKRNAESGDAGRPGRGIPQPCTLGTTALALRARGIANRTSGKDPILIFAGNCLPSRRGHVKPL